jgi:hypothetical protein
MKDVPLVVLEIQKFEQVLQELQAMPLVLSSL